MYSQLTKFLRLPLFQSQSLISLKFAQLVIHLRNAVGNWSKHSVFHHRSAPASDKDHSVLCVYTTGGYVYI